MVVTRGIANAHIGFNIIDSSNIEKHRLFAILLCNTCNQILKRRSDTKSAERYSLYIRWNVDTGFTQNLSINVFSYAGAPVEGSFFWHNLILLTRMCSDCILRKDM